MKVDASSCLARARRTCRRRRPVGLGPAAGVLLLVLGGSAWAQEDGAAPAVEDGGVPEAAPAPPPPPAVSEPPPPPPPHASEGTLPPVAPAAAPPPAEGAPDVNAPERRFAPTMGFHLGPAVAGVVSGPPNPLGWTLRAGLRFSATPRLPYRVSPALGLSLLGVLESLERVDNLGGGLALRVGLALLRPVHLFFPTAEFYALAGLTVGAPGGVVQPVARLGLGAQLNFLTVFDSEAAYGEFVLKLAVGVFESLLSDFRLWWLLPFYPAVLGVTLAGVTAGMLGNLELVYTPVLGPDGGRLELRVGFGF